MAKELDTAVEAFRSRPLDAGPYTFVAADALVLKVREGGRVVNVHALIAVGVNAEGYREILGIDVTTAEDGAGWLTFGRSLTARGLSGVKLVTSDAHAGLVAAIGATLPGAAWQRCRTHYTTNLMAVTPKASWPWVRTLLHSVFDQPDAESVAAQYDRDRRRTVRQAPQGGRITWKRPDRICWRSLRSPSRFGAKSGLDMRVISACRAMVGAAIADVSSWRRSVVFVPCLVTATEHAGVFRLGHRLLDDYLAMVAARCRPNTVLATAFDLKVFFTVVGKDAAEVNDADVLSFIRAQRQPRRGVGVVRIEDGEAGLSARTIKRRLASVTGLFEYLVMRGVVVKNPVRMGCRHAVRIGPCR